MAMPNTTIAARAAMSRSGVAACTILLLRFSITLPFPALRLLSTAFCSESLQSP